MKIAILLTGHLRTFYGLEQNFYDNVIKPNSDHYIDIFFHTYFDNSVTSTTFSIIKPTLLTFEKEVKSNDNIHNINIRYNKLQRNFKLMTSYSTSNNIEYDIIMFTRPDIFHYENLVFKMLDDDYILHSREKHEKGYPSDICFYGNKTTMYKIIGDFYIEKGLCPHTKLSQFRLISGTYTDIIRNINENGELIFLKESEM